MSEFALQELRKNGIEVIVNTRLVGAEGDNAKLSNGAIIPCNTLIWTGGVSPGRMIVGLKCDDDKSGRIVANSYLEIPGYKDAYAVGDCVSITDPRTGNPYPPTAQNALDKVAANNLVSLINSTDEEAETKTETGSV